MVLFCSLKSQKNYERFCSCNFCDSLENACCSNYLLSLYEKIKSGVVSLYFVFHFFYRNSKHALYIFLYLYVKMEKEKQNLKDPARVSIRHKKLAIFWIYIFINCVKNKNQCSILNLIFQCIIKTKWHFGYTYSEALSICVHYSTFATSIPFNNDLIFSWFFMRVRECGLFKYRPFL